MVCCVQVTDQRETEANNPTPHSSFIKEEGKIFLVLINIKIKSRIRMKCEVM